MLRSRKLDREVWESPSLQRGVDVKQAILDLEKLEADLTERFGSAEIAEEVIRDHIEEVAHGWTGQAVSEQALTYSPVF